MTDLLLSICIPTYNRAERSYFCVKRCLEIKGDFFEVVVCDNASEDDTYEKLKSINDKRFHYYRNEENIRYRNVVFCASKGQGKWLMILSDEDYIACENWELVKHQLENQNQTAVFLSTVFQPINKDVDYRFNVFTAPPPYILSKNTMKAYMYIINMGRYSSGYVFKKSIFEEILSDVQKEKYLYSIYPHMVTALISIERGDLSWLYGMNIMQGEQDKFGDPKSIMTIENEPYYSINSRLSQACGFLNVINKLNIQVEEKVKTFFEIICDYLIKIPYYVDFLCSKNNDNLCESLYRDKLFSKNEWKHKFWTDYKKLAKITNKYCGYDTHYMRKKYHHRIRCIYNILKKKIER